MKPKMLIIDDEVENVNIFNLQYSNKWDVVGILTPHDLLKKATFIQESQPDIIFLDLLFEQNIPKEENSIKTKFESGSILGVKFLDFIQYYMGSVPVIVMSGIIYPFIWDHIKSRYPYVKCLSKPYDVTSKEFEKEILAYSKGYYSNRMDYISRKMAISPQETFTDKDFELFRADFLK